MNNKQESNNLIMLIIVALGIFALLVGIIKYKSQWGKKPSPYSLLKSRSVANKVALKSRPFANKIAAASFNPKTSPEAFYLPANLIKTVTDSTDVKKSFDQQPTDPNYLPYFYQEDEKGNIEILARSEKGVQKYNMSFNQLNLILSEQELDKDLFENKVDSLTIFQYQDKNGGWQNYKLASKISSSAKKGPETLILIRSFGLESKNGLVEAEIEFEIGVTSKGQKNKLTFRLKENNNTNRVVWQNKILDQELSPDNLEGKGKTEKLGNIIIDWQDFNQQTKTEASTDKNSHLVYFYPEGKKGSIEIDPTVSTTVSSTQVVITQPGRAKWTIQLDGVDYLDDLRIPDTDGTNIANTGAYIAEFFGEIWIRGTGGDYTDYHKAEVVGGTRGTDWDVYVEEITDTRVVVHSWWDMEYADGTYLEGVTVTTDWVFTPYSLLLRHHAFSDTDSFDSFGSRNAIDDFGADMEYKIAAGSWTNVLVDDSTPDMDIDDTYTSFRDNGASSVRWLGLVNDIEEEDFSQTNSGYSDYWGRMWAPRITLDGTGRTDAEAYLIWLADDADLDSDLVIINSDYRNPDDLTFATGSGWYDTDENTSSTADEFNETESIYCGIGTTGSTFINLDIDGGTYTRYKPIFKFRSWRDYADPTSITLESVTLTDETDYNIDISPFSEAWVYDSGSTWQSLAEGGDTGDADEYLDDATNDFDFDQAGYDIFDNVGDYFYLGSHDQFTGVNLDLDTVGTGSPTLTWQYCSSNSDTNTACDSWSTLSTTDTDSGANDMTASGNFYFSDPAGWVASTENSGRAALWWIRAYISSGSFTDFPIENTIRSDIITFQYLSDISSDSQTLIFNAATPTPTNAPIIQFEGVNMEGVKID